MDLQQKIKAQVDNLDCKATDFINLDSTELSPKSDQTEKVCAACILVLAQCEIVSAQLEIEKQLTPIVNKNKSPNDSKTIPFIDAAIKKIEMPNSMRKWITSKNLASKEIPNAKIQKWLDPKLRELFEKTFPGSMTELPTLP